MTSYVRYVVIVVVVLAIDCRKRRSARFISSLVTRSPNTRSSQYRARIKKLKTFANAGFGSPSHVFDISFYCTYYYLSKPT
jgi:hypothetical protein